MSEQLVECKKIEWLKNEKETRTFSREFAVSLADSIRVEGLHQAIVVRPNSAKPGFYLGVAGKHRAYAVGKVLKESHIKASVVPDMDETDADMAMIAENLWRNPLTKPQHSICLKKWYAHFQEKAPARAVATKADSPKPKPEPAADDPAEPEAECQTDISGQQQAGFVKTVAAATGQSESSVARSHRIAQSFDEEQLEVFAQMSVSQTDMLTVAKIKDDAHRGEVVNLIASGMEPSDAIKEVMKDKAPVRDNGSGKDVVKAKEAAKEEKAPELTDAEWFATYCGEKAALLGDTAKFKADALLFRKITDPRHAFRAKVKASLKATAEAGTKGSFHSLVNRLVSITHPKDWFLCNQCKGSGKVETDKCDKCYGGGYLLKTEEYL